MSIDEGRDQFEEQRFEDERRREREADHAPSGEHVFRVPVLLGGPGDGRPCDISMQVVALDESGAEELYRPGHVGVVGSPLRVLYMAWSKFTDVESRAAAWEWLVRAAFEGDTAPGPVDAAEVARKIRAVAAVLRRSGSFQASVIAEELVRVVQD